MKKVPSCSLSGDPNTLVPKQGCPAAQAPINRARSTALHFHSRGQQQTQQPTQGSKAMQAAGTHSHSYSLSSKKITEQLGWKGPPYDTLLWAGCPPPAHPQGTPHTTLAAYSPSTRLFQRLPFSRNCAPRVPSRARSKLYLITHCPGPWVSGQVLPDVQRSLSKPSASLNACWDI